MPDARHPSRTCLIAGHVCIDDNEIDGIRATSWGSSCCFISHYLHQAHADLAPRVLAPYGTDFLPYAQGLDLLAPPHDGQTMRYRNVVRGDRRTQWCEHAEQPLPSLDAQVRAQVRDAQLLFVTPLAPTLAEAWVDELLAAATGVTVLLPQGLLRAIGSDSRVRAGTTELAERFAGKFDYVIYSDEDHPEALPMAERVARSSRRTTAIVTQNRHGATVIRHGRHALRVPAVPLAAGQVRQPIGAGDVFGAAFGVAVAEGLGLERAVQAAHRAAAAHITQA